MSPLQGRVRAGAGAGGAEGPRGVRLKECDDPLPDPLQYDLSYASRNRNRRQWEDRCRGCPPRGGAVVAVVTRGADESFSLTKAQENELLAAMAEIDRGEYVTLEELLQSLPKHD